MRRPALLTAPREACANLDWLEQEGYLSLHGFYDAVDYTAGLSRPGSPAKPCKIVMAHHSGMTLLARSRRSWGRRCHSVFCGTRPVPRTTCYCRNACRETSVRSIRKPSIRPQPW